MSKPELNKKLIFLVFFTSYAFVGVSQIIDDTTKLVYGPTTTVFTLEKYVQEIDSIFFPIDTTINNFEKFEFIQKNELMYQNLGANGTALKQIYYSIPETVGKTAGYESYSPYVKSTEKFKYYNTRSPFIDLDVAFGGNNRTLVDFSFSRNVTPNLNVGFDIQRLNTDKQIGAETKIGDNNVLSSTVDIYTYYASKNKKYTLLFHALKFTHKVNETGGVTAEDLSDERLLYQYLDSDIVLRNAGVQDVRTRYHMFNQYSLKPFFQLYHVFDKLKQENFFGDFSLGSTTGFYENFFISSDTTNEVSVLDEIRNQVGIKGKFSSKLFYNAYIKRRDLDFTHNNSGDFGRVSETYLGGKLKYLHNENNDIEAAFEVLQSGEYFFKGNLNNKYFQASYSSSIYKPSFVVDRYLGNHYNWTNDFKSTFVNTIEGSMNLDLNMFSLKPKISISSIDDYVYFDSNKLPAQADLAIINNYSLSANLKLKNDLHFDHQIIFNNVTGDGSDAFRIPKWNVSGRWYYDGIAFNDYMQFQVGVDLQWRSGYFAKAYDPITQQFHIQNDFKIDSYFIADVFFVFKAKKARIFAKVTHVNQPTEGGYMATPFYPGQQRVFDLGIRWLFFD